MIDETKAVEALKLAREFASNIPPGQLGLSIEDGDEWTKTVGGKFVIAKIDEALGDKAPDSGGCPFD